MKGRKQKGKRREKRSEKEEKKKNKPLFIIQVLPTPSPAVLSTHEKGKELQKKKKKKGGPSSSLPFSGGGRRTLKIDNVFV